MPSRRGNRGIEPVPGATGIELGESTALFSLSSDGGGGEGRGEESCFYWISPLPNPLPARSSRGEGEEEAPPAPRAFGTYPADSSVSAAGGGIVACVRAAMHPCWPVDGDATQRIPATLADHDGERARGHP